MTSIQQLKDAIRELKTRVEELFIIIDDTDLTDDEKEDLIVHAEEAQFELSCLKVS